MKVITIGRSAENDIVINDAKVSRSHLQIVQNDSGVCSVVDLNSSNGTFVNGQRISGEVRLQQNDVIRIGNTTLPWQEYIKTSSSEKQKSPNRKWWYIAASVVFVLLAVGIGLYYNGKAHDKKAAEQKQEELRKEQARLEDEKKLKQLEDEADEFVREELISQSEKNKILAKANKELTEDREAKRQDAADAKKKFEAEKKAKEAEMKRAEAAEQKRIAEEKARKAAEENRIAEEKARKKAEKDAQKANSERDSAVAEAQMTAEFYEEYAAMKPEFAKQVCKQLQYELPKEKNDARTALKDLFNVRDNNGKQAVIDAIKAVKLQNSKIKTNEPEIKPDSLASAKGTEPIEEKSTEESNE